MNRMLDLLITDLRHLVSDLGKDGGLTSPSIYDTAQVLRLAPESEGACVTLNWLLAQQQADGGWGNPAMPLTRDVPTLASILALSKYGNRPGTYAAPLRAGLAFLERQAQQWRAPLSDDIPSAVELLLPRLLEDAAAVGLDLDQAPYSELIALGRRRRQMIARLRPLAGTAAVHSWEAWGSSPDPAVIDGSGGVGHSPAATAAWLCAAGDRPELGDMRVAAERYLAGAAASTGVGVPGVMPNAWPIARTEQATALYGILLAGLLDHPTLNDSIQPILTELARALTPIGLGTSDYFVTDGDDTAMALACLAGRRKVSIEPMMHFAIDSHFSTYVGELQPSLSVTAHAIHALGLLGKPAKNASDYLRERQHADGSWRGDKWNGSWLYTTCHTLAALLLTENSELTTVLTSIRASQRADGGWGLICSNSEETAYAVMALLLIGRAGELPVEGQAALKRAATFLEQRYRPFKEETTAVWLAKEPYRPRRVSRAFEISALLALAIEGYVV
ncbi:MAG: prenyltransferase/squalene oxidase repeat-containing protein [Roseiflexaceae bacterium]